jgi:hypothetical protein
MAVHEGYLIRHDRTRAHVCFFRLEDGYMKYYESLEPSAALIGAFRLSGCKVNVKALKRTDGVSHSFFIQSERVVVKDGAFALSPRDTLELSAVDQESRAQWGRAIITWQRHYFGDDAPSKKVDHAAVRKALQETVQSHLKPVQSKTRSKFRIPSLSSLKSNMSIGITAGKGKKSMSFTLPIQPAISIA